jgi:phage virion morphogenesis protein
MIEIKVDDKEAKKALAALMQRGGDLAPVTRVIAGIMHDEVEQNFEEEGRPKWKALSGSTIKQREQKGHWPGKMLQDEGRLAGSIEAGSDDSSAWVGTNLVYAPIQHFGGNAGRGLQVTIPERPFMRLSDEGMEKIQKAVLDHVAGAHI